MRAKSFLRGNRFVLVALAGSLVFLRVAQAQPTIVSTVPANDATGVSTTTTIVFTFSAAMNPSATAPTFYDPSVNLYPTAPAWSAGNTVLTCTPGSAFPGNTEISWYVTGQSAGGQQLGGIPAGRFTTVGTGSPLVLTNAVSTPANFSFAVLCTAGQTVTVQYRTNLAVGAWQTLLTTNSPGSSFRAVAPQAATNLSLFFRAKDGL